MTSLDPASVVTPRSAPQSFALPIQAVWAIWVIGFGLLSMISPRDIGFDVSHYQIINGWSAVHGRLGYDLAPAEMHSFINPAYNAVVWWLIEALPGPLVSFVLGTVQSLGLIALYYLTRNVAAAQGMRLDWRVVALVAIVGFFATSTISLFASIRNDHMGATAFIGALALIIRADGKSPAMWQLALASALLGAVAGIKLTNIVYIAGFAVAALVVMQGWRSRMIGAGICAIAGAAAFLALAGPWMWTLYQEFGNPVYPMMGHLFPALENPSHSARDVRYLPDGFFAALVHPIVGSVLGDTINEEPTRDFRLLFFYLGALGILSALVFGRRSGDPRRQPVRGVVALAAGGLVFLAAWVALFSIQRYGMGAYQLGPLMALALAWLWRIDRFPAERLRLWTLLVCIFFAATTVYDADRRSSWTSPMERYVEVERPADFGFDESMIFMSAGFPSGVVGTAFPEARLTHVAAQAWSRPFLDNYRPRITAAVASHDGPFYVVAVVQPPFEDAAREKREQQEYNHTFVMPRLAEVYGLERTEVACQPLRTNFDTALTHWEICPLRKAGVSVAD